MKRLHQDVDMVIHDHISEKPVPRSLEVAESGNNEEAFFLGKLSLVLVKSPGQEIGGAFHAPMRKLPPVDAKCLPALW